MTSRLDRLVLAEEETKLGGDLEKAKAHALIDIAHSLRAISRALDFKVNGP